MFVCHGNICRSPMAELLLRHKAEAAGVGDRLEIASSAVSDEEIGNGVYPPVARLLGRLGINCSGKRAVALRRDDYGKYDYFFGMDRSKIAWMLRIFGSDPCGKIHRLLDFTSDGGDIADPWYTSDFEKTDGDVLNNEVETDEIHS